MVRYFSLSQEHLRIPCKIYEPDFGAPKQCILGVHGFGAGKDAHILAALSEEMSIFGAATVCFDFPAHGENPQNTDTHPKAVPSGLERHKRLSIVCVERWSQSNEEQEQAYRATRDEYATRVGKRWSTRSEA